GAGAADRAQARRLRLEGHNAQLALGEVATLLNRGEQPLVVEMAVAEVVAEDDAGDELSLTDVVVLDVVDGAGAEPVERPAMGMHREKREPFVEEDIDQVVLVELGQLLGDDRRRLDDLLVEALLGPVSEQPLAG